MSEETTKTGQDLRDAIVDKFNTPEKTFKGGYSISQQIAYRQTRVQII